MTVKISMVPHDRVDSVWPLVREMFAVSMHRTGDRFTPESLLEDMRLGNDQLWIVFDDDGIFACASTRVIEYPVRRILGIQYCGGTRMTEWLPGILDLMERWAKDNDCQAMEGGGRIGWERALAKYGWGRVSAVYEKELV